jgi:hypothetical protein
LLALQAELLESHMELQRWHPLHLHSHLVGFQPNANPVNIHSEHGFYEHSNVILDFVTENYSTN